MRPFERDYADLLFSLGRVATDGDGTPASEIDSAEQHLGVRAPASLRAFYRVAGRATDLTEVSDHFLQPHAWRVESGTVVFMEENQAVTLYGISTGAGTADDPPVLAAWNDEDLAWSETCGRTSEFIKVMLCWAAVQGDVLRHRGEAPAPPDIVKKLAVSWSFVGQIGVSNIRAYLQHGRVLCHLDDLSGSRAFFGARSSDDLNAIKKELDLRGLRG
jgi:hypothetical protein